MDMKSLNLDTGEVEDISEDDIKVLNAIKDQFDKDAQTLIAEREIVNEILKQAMIQDGDEDVCTD